jgi:hypothetical protein
MDAPNDSMSWAGLLDNELAGVFWAYWVFFLFSVILFCHFDVFWGSSQFSFFLFCSYFYIIFSFHLVLPVVFNELFSKLLSNFNYFRFEVS